MTLDAIEIAQYQFGVATEYLNAAIKLYQSDNAPCRPMYFLICHSIEIYLKSALTFRGYDEKALKALGHNINKCFAAAFEQANCLDLDEMQRQIISRLSAYHQDMSFRYFRHEPKQLFSFDETVRTVRAVSNVVYNEIVSTSM